MDEEMLELIAKAEMCASALEFCSAFNSCRGCPKFNPEVPCHNDVETANVVRIMARKLVEAYDKGAVR